MGKYVVTSEAVVVHKAIVLADTVDEAAENYLDGEWEEDLGEVDDGLDSIVLSVELVEEK